MGTGKEVVSGLRLPFISSRVPSPRRRKPSRDSVHTPEGLGTDAAQQKALVICRDLAKEKIIAA